MKIKKLYIFRHGETDWNVEGRFQGHIDVPLNERGREQARQLVLKLREHGLQAILSSDLRRAYETAEIVASALDAPLYTDPGLREAHLGKAQGLTYEEISAAFGSELVTRWRSHNLTDADVCYPEGETGKQIMRRAFAAMEKFLAEHDYGCVGVSTHGGVIRRVMQHLLPPEKGPVPIPNTVSYGLYYEVQSEMEARVMKTFLACALIFAGSMSAALARADDLDNTRLTNPNVLGVEVFGRGLEIGFEFDRALNDDFVAGIGYGFVPLNYSDGTSANETAQLIPVFVNYYFARNGSSLFATAGADLVANAGTASGLSTNISSMSFTSSALIPTFGLGYENRNDFGFLFRVAGYGIVGNRLIPWLGFTFGYAF